MLSSAVSSLCSVFKKFIRYPFLVLAFKLNFLFLFPDPSSLMYAVQQQALGSIQWTIIASCLKQTTYTITNLTKGVRYAFRVLSITSKAFSKPSPATEPVQLLDRGTPQQTRTATVRQVNEMYVTARDWLLSLRLQVRTSRRLL